MKPAHLPSDQLELLEHGAGITGHPLREFRHCRVQQEYPPTQTSLVVRRRLPA